MYPGGNIIRITPTVSATAYADNDVLFNATEIPNAVSSRGGVSRLVAISIHDQAAQGKDLDLIFMEESTNLISGGISPGSSGGVDLTDANLEAAKIIANINIDFTDGESDLVASRISTATAVNVENTSQLPILLKAAGGSTSVYVAGIAREATDLVAVDDIDLVFHIEYLG